MERRLLLVVMIILCLVLFIALLSLNFNSYTDKVENGRTHSLSSEREIKLKDELKYLNDITDISWWEVDNNTVYICFKTAPSDWRLILQFAALRGNVRIGFGTHAWGLVGAKYGWRPGDGYYLGVETARYGKIK